MIFRTLYATILAAVLFVQYLNAGEFDRNIESAVRYVIRHCDGNGRFTYWTMNPSDREFFSQRSATNGSESNRRAEARMSAQPRWVDQAPEQTIPGEYNQVRHAGMLYALSMAADWAEKNGKSELRAEIIDVMKRAAGFMLKRVAPVPRKPGCLALWSPPDEIDFGDETIFRPDEAKLGGTGLALVSLRFMETTEPGIFPRETLDGLGRFLCEMTLSDGSTLGSLDAQGRVKTLVALYYPGEAALGLCAMHRYDPEGPWLETARKLLSYLAENDWGLDEKALDHWTPIAATEYFRLAKSPDSSTRQRLHGHAAKVAKAVLDEQIVDDKHPFFGAFEEGGGLCGVSTRLECLGAALQLLPESEYRNLKSDIRKSMRRGVDFLVRFQILEGPVAGGVPGSPTSGEIRIDFVQHFLSALILADTLSEHAVAIVQEQM